MPTNSVGPSSSPVQQIADLARRQSHPARRCSTRKIPGSGSCSKSFFHTTSTYFEVGEADDPVPRTKSGNMSANEQDAEGRQAGLRIHGK